MWSRRKKLAGDRAEGTRSTRSTQGNARRSSGVWVWVWAWVSRGGGVRFAPSRHRSNRILLTRCLPRQISHDWSRSQLSQTLRLSVGHPDCRYWMRKHCSGITDYRVYHIQCL